MGMPGGGDGKFCLDAFWLRLKTSKIRMPVTLCLGGSFFGVSEKYKYIKVKIIIIHRITIQINYCS